MSGDNEGKVATTVYLRPDQQSTLAAVSKRTGAPVAYHVRQAIDDYLAALWSVHQGKAKARDEGEIAAADVARHGPPEAGGD